MLNRSSTLDDLWSINMAIAKMLNNANKLANIFERDHSQTPQAANPAIIAPRAIGGMNIAGSNPGMNHHNL